MYATEKYVRMEAKDLQSSIREVASDLGGDIRYLHQEISELRTMVEQMMQEIDELRDRQNGHI